MFKRLSLSLRTLFSLTPSRSPSSYSIFVAQCSTSAPSPLTYPHPHSHPDPRNVKVMVYWDIRKCPVPSDVNPLRVVKYITLALKSSGIKGPIRFTALADIFKLSDTTKYALDGTGIQCIPAPCGKDYDDYLDKEFKNWTCNNPPPAHILLIGCSSQLLYSLRIKGYNILLAGNEPFPVVLSRTATIVWNWHDLVRGENLSGRHVNHPPNDSGNGHYEGPLPASAEHNLFSRESFWRDLQVFINTDVASFIIAHSRTRENLACLLQECGPSDLKSVTKRDVLHMVDMLISEKKWVDETASLVRPFKLTSSALISGQKL